MEKTISATVFLLLIWSQCLIAAEVAYEFVTVDIPVGQNKTAFPEDIDDDGTLLANTTYFLPDNLVLTVDPNPRRAKNKNVSFECGDTYGAAISNGRIAGYCTDGAFVRQKDGTLVILSGLEQPIAWGIAKDGTVGGQYCTPNGPPNFGCTGHGFIWHPDRGYKTIDYIDGRPGSYTHSVVLSPTANGRALGWYIVQEVGTNNYIEQGYYLYDNGSFDTTLPKFYDPITGLVSAIIDINELGQMIIHRFNAGPSRLELFDDGIFYQIAGWPAEWHLILLNGSNNEGQFTGSYSIDTGLINPYDGRPIYAQHGFVATPSPIRKAKKHS